MLRTTNSAIIVPLLVLWCCMAYAAAETPAFAALQMSGLPALRQVNSRLIAPRSAPPAVRAAVLQFTVPGRSDSGKTGGTSVLDKPEVATAPQADDQLGKDKMYHVLLFNDPVNTREYVCKIIVEVFGHTKSKAYEIMNHAHTSGFAVCVTTGKDEADGMSGELNAANLMSSVVEASGNED